MSTRVSEEWEEPEWWSYSYDEMTPEQRKAMEDSYAELSIPPPRPPLPTACPKCRATIERGQLFGIIHGNVIICSKCYNKE